MEDLKGGMGEVLGDTLPPPQLPCRKDSRETTTSLRHFLKPLLTLGTRNLTLHIPVLSPGSWLHLPYHRHGPAWEGFLRTVSTWMLAPTNAGESDDLTD